MVRDGQLGHGQQHKELRNFVDKFDLNTITPEQEQQPHVLREILNNHNSRYSELPRRMKKRKERTADAQQHGGQVFQSNTLEGCVDHLLILAQSAEIVEQSEDGAARTNVNNQNKDQDCSGDLFYSSVVVSHVSTQRCGINYEDARPRLTQIRKQARCKYLTLDEERGEDSQRKNTCLSQIKHQARCRSKNSFLQKEMIMGPRIEVPQGRILRLSKIKHLARSKGNSTVKDGFKDDMNKNQHCNTYKDSNLSMFECVPTHNVFTGTNQSSSVKWDDENLQELQRTASRLRAFKPQKLRQRLRTQCIENSDALMEFMPAKRLRLTHLRHEVRSRNQCSVVEGSFEN